MGGAVSHVLYEEQIKYLKSIDLWPAAFASSGAGEDGEEERGNEGFDYGDSDGSFDDDFVNPNHVGVGRDSDDDDEDDEYSF